MPGKLTKTETAALRDLFEAVLRDMPPMGDVLNIPMVLICYGPPTMQARYLRRAVHWLEEVRGCELALAHSWEWITALVQQGLAALPAEGQARP